MQVDERGQEVVLGQLDPILGIDLTHLVDVLARQAPMTGPQLDEGEIGKKLGSHPLIAVPPCFELDLEPVARPIVFAPDRKH